MNQPIWKPSAERIAASNLHAFASLNGYPPDYETLYNWSINEPEQFWQAVWSFGGVIASETAGQTVVDFQKLPGARWFPGAKFNYAENLLKKADDSIAIVFRGEGEARRILSYQELHREVACLAAALRAQGVQAGDRVAAFIPNIPEAVIGMLAASSLGAIWSSCSPDFGINGVLDRFGQIAPKVLISSDGYFYKGKRFDSLKTVQALQEAISSIESTVIVPFTGSGVLSGLKNTAFWVDFVNDYRGSKLSFEQLPFDHPLYILYSSGTTGKPKCICHCQGGILLEHLKELLLQSDLKPEDKIFYHTTCGWMMWNWLVSSLAVGSTIILYDGFPFYPNDAALIDLLEQEQVTIFGTSARYISAIDKAGVVPAKTHKLDSLRTILSTGSPLLPENFDYIYSSFKKDLHLASISGGTDIVGCFAAGNPIGPVYRGELQARCLGKKVEVYDETGKPLRGEAGELVCLAPFPSVPIYFWGDVDGSKFRSAYFDHFPGVWRHGDWAEITPNNGVIIYGRSDAVLNPGGVRIGTAEIYRQVEQIPEILESLAIGQKWQGDERILLFVKMRSPGSLTENLIAQIKDRIRNGASPRHVPALMIEVPDIPRTLSGKIVELAVRNVIEGKPIKNLEALANPESLKYFKNLLLS